MRISQPGWADVILPLTSQSIRSGRGDEIDIAYIRCINGRVPEAFELWFFTDDRICGVHPFARVQIRDNCTEDIFYTIFFNALQVRVPFLGRRSVLGTV